MAEFGLLLFQSLILTIMVIGLFGLLTTIIPGLTIIWLAALVYGIVTGFNWVGWVLFALITVLMLFGNLVDNLLMGASARQTGASWLAVVVALVAGVAGSLIWPPFGGLIAALVGLFAVEFIRVRNLRKALDSTRAMAAGCGYSVVARFAIGIFMIGWWLVWIFLRYYGYPS